MDINVTSTGFGQEFATSGIDRIPDYDPDNGEHYWTVNIAYRFNPGSETHLLDLENLVLLTGPDCFHCGETYLRGVTFNRCLGPA